MVKCKDCIFEFDSVCKNPESDEDGMRVFVEYDGCNDGKKSTVGISNFQKLVLMCEGFYAMVGESE